MTVYVCICTCTWGSLLVALIKHNAAVALETAFLPWHSWRQGDVAGCDMILCGLWFSQGCEGSQDVGFFSLVHEYIWAMWANRCRQVSFKEVLKLSFGSKSGKASHLGCRCALGPLLPTPWGMAPIPSFSEVSSRGGRYWEWWSPFAGTGGHVLGHPREYPMLVLHKGMLAVTLYLGYRGFLWFLLGKWHESMWKHLVWVMALWKACYTNVHLYSVCWWTF